MLRRWLGQWNRRTGSHQQGHMFKTALHTATPYSIVWKCSGSIITLRPIVWLYAQLTLESPTWWARPRSSFNCIQTCHSQCFWKKPHQLSVLTQCGHCRMFQNARQQKLFTVCNPHFLTQCSNTCEPHSAIVEEGGGGIQPHLCWFSNASGMDNSSLLAAQTVAAWPFVLLCLFRLYIQEHIIGK